MVQRVVHQVLPHSSNTALIHPRFVHCIHATFLHCVAQHCVHDIWQATDVQHCGSNNTAVFCMMAVSLPDVVRA